MLLHTLLQRVDPFLGLGDIANLDICGVQEDSRRVLPGDLFVARQGTRTDGVQFVRDAATRGAVAAVAAAPIADCPIPLIVLADPAAAVSVIAQAIAGDPSHQLKLLGVTGTNGKTTVAYLLRDILNAARHKCGMIGTVEIDDGASRREAAMTTPAPIDLAAMLRAMRDNGCGACAMEVSSHSLDQGRVAGIRYAGAAFTNLTGDHLDYHKSMDAYADAKAKLFDSLEASDVAVVNARDPWSARMTRNCRARVVRFGSESDADWRAEHVVVSATGTRFDLVAPKGAVSVDMGLIGRHNVENALAAAALAGEAMGLNVQQIAASLQTATGAPGRLQPVRKGQPFAVMVDYAHTDDALQNVLQALRPLCKGRLRVLFGCGGDRDATKRPRMAAVAARLADVVYVTSDNPRTEDPDAIIRQVLTGMPADTKGRVVVESDRRVAIDVALADARSGDVVLLAGKGHENYQIIGTERRPFDDVEEAERAIATRVLA